MTFFPSPLRNQVHKDDLEARLAEVREMESTLTLNIKDLDDQRKRLQEEAQEHEKQEEAIMKRLQSTDEVRLIEIAHPPLSTF